MQKVSLIVPVYNLSKCLRRCLESIQCQTYANLEVLLIDDGSQDDSLAICQDYESRDTRFHAYHFENGGVSVARNRGLDLITGDCLMFIDGDDQISPDYVKSYVDAMESNEADVVIGGLTRRSNGISTELRHAQTGYFGQELWNRMCTDDTGIFGFTPNKMYLAEIIQRNRIRFNSELKLHEDLDFAVSVYAQCNTFVLINEVGYLYDFSEGRHCVDQVKFAGIKLKMLCNALAGGKLEIEPERLLIRQISGLVRYYLLHLERGKEFIPGCSRLQALEPLVNETRLLAKLSLTSDAGYLTWLALRGYYGLVKAYCYLRACLK